MTITEPTSTSLEWPTVVFDLYRDIHKGIRDQMFSVTVGVGRADPSARADRAEVAARVGGLVDLLVAHAEHEDGAIQPVLVETLPDLAQRIETEHAAIEDRLVVLRKAADVLVEGTGINRHDMHALYCELAAFTGVYLDHQDVEERVVMPALEAAIGVEEVVAIHGRILSAIPPDEMAASLALMFPTMNVDELTEMFEGMRATAPPEAVEGVWALAGSVVSERTRATLAGRLGLA